MLAAQQCIGHTFVGNNWTEVRVQSSGQAPVLAYYWDSYQCSWVQKFPKEIPLARNFYKYLIIMWMEGVYAFVARAKENSQEKFALLDSGKVPTAIVLSILYFRHIF
jgi:hypothetical protein